MYLVKLRALRPLKGNYGTVGPGDLFTTDNFHADDLEARGIAERFYQLAVEPKAVAVPENKAVTATENKTVETGGHRRKRGRR